MLTRLISRPVRLNVPISSCRPYHHYSTTPRIFPSRRYLKLKQHPSLRAPFHSTVSRYAQSPTADALMENINDLYATAKDEFEIAAEETERKTVYAEGDREAAREALTILKEALDRAVKESDPEVAKDVKIRVGKKIQELENAVIAMEERAMED